MKARDFESKMEDLPFEPFRAHLSDGTTIVVSDPGSVVVGLSSVVLPTEWGSEDGRRYPTRFRKIALSHVVQFSELDDMVGGKRPKPRPGKKK